MLQESVKCFKAAGLCGQRVMMRTILHFARKRPQTILATAVGLISALLIASMISSCHTRRYTSPIPMPPPSAGIVRVRLLAWTTSVRAGATGPYRLLAGGKTIGGAGRAMPDTTIRRIGGQWLVGTHAVKGPALRIEPKSRAGLVRCNGRAYRGAMVLRAPSDTQARQNRFHVDNHVPMESYLVGVLARELLGGWRQETYKALAVAARTYALYETQHAGRNRSFDVYADQRSQVYGGVTDETPKSLAAVRQTQGQVLTVGPAGSRRVFKAYYSSCCGGVTNPADGLEPQAELVGPLSGGVACDDCAFSSRYRWPAVRIPKADVFAALANSYSLVAMMGGLKEIRIRSATAWGRPQWLNIIPLDGDSTTVRADDLRLALLRAGAPDARRLYSMNCTIRDLGDSISFEDGRGFGHGVGLCQYGAEGKARRGMNYVDILLTYYRSARITHMGRVSHR